MSLNTQKNTKVSKNNEDSDAGEFDLFSWCRDPTQDALYDDKINSQNSSDELPNTEMEQLEKTARARYISSLPQKHRNLLLNIGLNEKFKTIHRCIERNSLFFLKVAHANRMMFDKDLFSSKEDKATESGERDNNAEVPSKQEIFSFINLVSEEVEEPFDPRYMDKLSSALKILVRDWSEEGSEERAATYGIILGVLKDIFCDVPKEKLNSIDILVPGAGLGRLAFEIANLGFNCEGNENDYLMLMISNFILNYTQQERQCTIYPYIHSFSNILNSGDMFRQINVPEILPSTLLMRSTSNFSMAAGDFVQSYKHGEQSKHFSNIL
ncbi:UPF0586 protein [Zancudomyces culisetae]|uniref:UPF0586 protein n=1 Tax=Zancudomyces culisetae TaxID=1213189 RepID=A0A1R1PPA0_ZANCU|nr:UPF0586 protein [Zancudomyces culisetae]OMH83177.1 UPF0586 protein [Zancudomyces culisetae]|eukprot:OMH82780.1 UPF0586 protein [Zancudomyces culisetae]